MDIRDHFLARKQAVQKTNQERFVHLLTKNPFETHIRKGVDKSSHILLSFKLIRKCNTFINRRQAFLRKKLEQSLNTSIGILFGYAVLWHADDRRLKRR